MRRNLFFFLMLLLTYSCSEQQLDVPDVKSEVVIIFSDAPRQLSGPSSVMNPESSSHVGHLGTVEYVDTLFNITGYTPKVVGLDTLIIPTFDGVAELMHAYAGGPVSNYFLLKAGDTLTYNQLESNKKLAVEKCDLIVEDWNGKQTNFLDVIKKYKGKKIYLDYWASWCAPCKNQMPASKKLKEANKNIVFLYVAVFDEKEQWRKGVTELGLGTADCYFAINSKNANYLTSLGVELILDICFLQPMAHC